MEIWEEVCRVEEELREEMEDESRCDEESVSRVGARVVAMEPLEVMVRVVLVVLGSNGLLVMCYLLYKRRKANGPKKYL